jgi:hypothetical protein
MSGKLEKRTKLFLTKRCALHAIRKLSLLILKGSSIAEIAVLI